MDLLQAKTFESPAFIKLLTFLKKNRKAADLLLFLKWDRFSRNAGDAYGMINQLNKLAVEPQAIEQPLDLNIPENKITPANTAHHTRMMKNRLLKDAIIQ